MKCFISHGQNKYKPKVLAIINKILMENSFSFFFFNL